MIGQHIVAAYSHSWRFEGLAGDIRHQARLLEQLAHWLQTEDFHVFSGEFIWQ